MTEDNKKLEKIFEDYLVKHTIGLCNQNKRNQNIVDNIGDLENQIKILINEINARNKEPKS